MRPRPLVLLAVLAALTAAFAISACGGSSGGETGETEPARLSGGTTEKEASASGDPFEQLRFILGKFPYRDWYRQCLISEVEGKLSVAELEELAQLPEERARRVALRFALGASPNCERKERDPIDPNADAVEVQLLRLGYATTLEALGKKEGLSKSQTSCLSHEIAGFSDPEVIELGNAGEKRREAILVGVIEECTE